MSNTASQATSPRGWHGVSPEQHRINASRGGKRAQQLGTAHRWQTSEEAQRAGVKGGRRSAEVRRLRRQQEGVQQ